VWIDGDGGTPLCADLYLPDGEGPFAPLLEALPYRKDDVTNSYREIYDRLVEAGFAVCRLDLRGTGSSGGSATDEYPTSSGPTSAPSSSGSRPSRGRPAGWACSAPRTRGSTRCTWRPTECRRWVRWSPRTPPTTASPTTSTTAAACFAPST
jgi:hypothetical protein